MATPTCSVLVRKVGRIGYASALTLQQSLATKYKDGRRSQAGEVLLCEHSPVFTFGLREKYFEQRSFELKRLGAEVFKIRRGGLVTFHGPGQLVCYPILNLKLLKIGVRQYVRCLEEAVIATLSAYGLHGYTTENTGVWIDNLEGDESKICAIGIQVSHGVTYHGLALNCSNDLSWFSHITPCGVEGKEVTSLSQLNRNKLIQPSDVEHTLVESLAKAIGFNVMHSESN